MKNKVAVIGSTSFLAKYLIQYNKNTFDFSGFSRTNTSGEIEHFIFDYPSMDIDYSKLLAFDAIVVCAARGLKNDSKVIDIYNLNTFFPIKLATYLNENEFRGKLITFGSYFEIGNNSVQKLFKEEEVLNSTFEVPNNYCVSKRILSSYFKSVRLNFQHFHLILPTIYGVGEDHKRLIPYVINSLKNNEKPKLTSGKQVREYVHAKDIADLISLLLQENNFQPGIYNVPGNEILPIKDLVSVILKEFDLTNEAIQISKERYDESMLYLSLNAAKLKAMIPNWHPSISISTSIKDYII
jgi:nucleoside-diphosphate-sugar epimerase